MILLSVREGCEAQKEPQQSMSVIDDWFREQIEQAFGDIHLVQENDGAILVLVARKFAQTIDIHRYGQDITSEVNAQLKIAGSSPLRKSIALPPNSPSNTPFPSTMSLLGTT